MHCNNVIKKRLSKLGSFLLAILTVFSTISAPLSTISAYAADTPITIDLTDTTVIANGFDMVKNQVYIVDKTQFINLSAKNLNNGYLGYKYTDNSIGYNYDDATELEANIYIAYSGEYKYSYSSSSYYSRYSIQDSTILSVDVTDNGDNTLSLVYTTSAEHTVSDSKKMHFYFKPETIYQHSMYFKVDTYSSYGNSSTTSYFYEDGLVSDALANENIQQLSDNSLTSLIGQIYDANTYYYLPYIYAYCDKYNEPAPYYLTAHNYHINVIDSITGENLNDEVTRYGGHDNSVGSGYMNGFLFYVGDEKATKYEVIDAYQSGITLAPYVDKLTFKDGLTKETIAVSVFDEDQGVYAAAQYRDGKSADDYIQKVWFDCITQDCTISNHFVTGSNAVNETIASWNTGIANNTQPFEGVKTFYLYKTGYDVPIYDLSLLGELYNSTTISEIFTNYANVMNGTNTKFTKPAHNVTTVYFVPVERIYQYGYTCGDCGFATLDPIEITDHVNDNNHSGWSSGSVLTGTAISNRNDYSFVLSDNKSTDSNLANAFAFVTRSAADQYLSQELGGSYSTTSITNKFYKTETLVEFNASDVARVLNDNKFLAGISGSYNTSYFSNDDYVDGSTITSMVHSNRKSASEVGLSTPITAHLYGAIGSSNLTGKDSVPINEINDLTTEMPFYNNYSSTYNIFTHASEVVYEYDNNIPNDYSIYGLATPLNAFTKSYNYDRYSNPDNNLITISTYSANGLDGTVSTTDGLLATTPYLTVFLPTADTTDAKCVDKGSVTYSIALADNMTTAARGFETSEEIDALGHTWDDDGWEQVADVNITATLFADADNASELDFSALKADDTVYKRICTRAQDAYEIKVVNHTHTPGNPQRENEIPATCTTSGSYKEVIRCTDCKEIISSEDKTIEPLGHTWSGDDWTKVDAENVNESLFTNAVNAENLVYGNLGTHDEVYQRPCSRAGDAYEVRVDVHTHTPDEAKRENEVPATCTTDGSYDLVVRCKDCKDIISSEAKTINALGHTWDNDGWSEVSHDDISDDLISSAENSLNISANDIEEQDVLKRRDCTRAGDAYELDFSKHTHTPGESQKENVVDPTCTVEGSYDDVVRCTECKTVISSEHHTVDPLGHTWNDNDWEQVAVSEITDVLFSGSENLKDKTTADVGKNDTVDKHLCSRASDAYQVRINVHTHTPGNPQRENVVDATCTEAGSYDWVTRCSNCGDIISSESKTIDPLGHTWENDDWSEIDPNTASETLFDEADNKATLDYSVFDPAIDKLNRRECHRAQDAYQLSVDPGHRHTPGDPKNENEIPATCTEAGSYDEVVRCSDCNEIISSTHYDVDALGHTWDDSDWFKQSKAMITAELFANAINATQLDYSALGKNDVVNQRPCHRAGDAYELNVVPHTHTPGESQKENEIPSTCTTGGSYDDVVRCTGCGDIISSEHHTTEPLGHTWASDDWSKVEKSDITRTLFDSAFNAGSLDFDELGVKDDVFTHDCTRAGDAYALKVVPHVHTPGDKHKENEKKATCTAKGSYDLVVRCADCGDILESETKETDALGHIWDNNNWKLVDKTNVTKELFDNADNHDKFNYSALKDTDKVYTRDCTRAGDAYEINVIDGSHTHRPGDPVKTNEKNATCTEKGSYDEVTKCKDCGEVLSTKHFEVDALGHIWKDDNWELVPAANVSASLFQNAHNHNQLNFSALQPGDQVWKHLCSRASDAYELKVVKPAPVTPPAPIQNIPTNPRVVKTGDTNTLMISLIGMATSAVAGLGIVGLKIKRKKEEDK